MRRRSTAVIADRKSALPAKNESATAKMMQGMTVRSSGNVDRDFAAMMMPLHQGATDMVLAELRFGRNERLRRILHYRGTAAGDHGHAARGRRFAATLRACP
jgi:uncharacterized protein (DUF305 family)